MDLLQLCLFQAILALKSLYPTCCEDLTLLPGKERMTLGANLNSQVLLGGTCFKSLPASTRNCSFIIFGMDTFFHNFTFFRPAIPLITVCTLNDYSTDCRVVQEAAELYVLFRSYEP